MNTRKVLMSSALGIAATGVLASVALASPGGDARGGTDDRRAEIAGRVAEIVGVDPADLQAAMTQARSEVHEEALAARIDAMVASGTLTDEEASAIQEWLAARPAPLDSVGGKMTHRGLIGPAGKERLHGPGNPSEQLARLVEAERITQEEVDVIVAWLDTRPEAMESLRADRSQDRDVREFGQGRQRGPRHPRMHGHGGPGFNRPGPTAPSDGDATQSGLPGWLQMIDPPATTAAYQ